SLLVGHRAVPRAPRARRSGPALLHLEPLARDAPHPRRGVLNRQEENARRFSSRTYAESCGSAAIASETSWSNVAAAVSSADLSIGKPVAASTRCRSASAAREFGAACT